MQQDGLIAWKYSDLVSGAEIFVHLKEKLKVQLYFNRADRFLHLSSYT